MWQVCAPHRSTSRTTHPKPRKNTEKLFKLIHDQELYDSTSDKKAFNS